MKYYEVRGKKVKVKKLSLEKILKKCIKKGIIEGDKKEFKVFKNGN